MTFDDDFLQFEFDGGIKRFTCQSLAVSWPPPETIDFQGFEMTLVGLSTITDQQRATMTHVCRGAVYQVKK